MYNKRGWANGLFNREDMKLLNEKYSELDRCLNSRTDNMLADGTRIVEVNNKIVMIGGTYNDPEIYGVFLINAENETYAEYIKGELFNDFRKRTRKKSIIRMLKKSGELLHLCMEKKVSDTIMRMIIAIKEGEGIQGREQRYQAILAVTDIIKKATSEEEVMKKLKEKYPQYC